MVRVRVSLIPGGEWRCVNAAELIYVSLYKTIFHRLGLALVEVCTV